MNRDMKEMTAFVRKYSISHVLTSAVHTLRTTKNNNTRLPFVCTDSTKHTLAQGWLCELWLESCVKCQNQNSLSTSMQILGFPPQESSGSHNCKTVVAAMSHFAGNKNIYGSLSGQLQFKV